MIIKGNDKNNTRTGTNRDDTIYGYRGDDTLYGRDGNDIIYGGRDADTIFGGAGRDFLYGGSGSDALRGSDGNDFLDGGSGDDRLFGGDGDDTVYLNAATDGSDTVRLGDGADTVRVDNEKSSEVRLTFTSSEVGNGNDEDSGALANQDGGLAVRLQREGTAGNLNGSVSRFDDEGITFVGVDGVKFDVRDLVSGAQRGNMFDLVSLGTDGNDTIDDFDVDLAQYINAGMGNDTVSGGRLNDFLVGGAGNDTLAGNRGNDSFIGGAGDDQIFGRLDDDTAIFNVSTDGSDRIDLGEGDDFVTVNATAPGQVRLTFTSSEVGNDSATDSDTMTNQDGGLAIRLQAEDLLGGLTGPISRVDDEGITFVAGAGVTFDVRDLVSGAARGDQFEVVALGTSGDDTMTAVQAARPYYFNAGMGNDTITGGTANDFLVGGAGNDTLDGAAGNDIFIAGGGNDALTGGTGTDAFIFNAPLSASANVDTISDFSHADDTIRLDNLVFTALPEGALGAGAFALSTDMEAADDRIIYDLASGALFYDADGNSRDNQVQFAVLANKPADLAADDFLII